MAIITFWSDGKEQSGKTLSLAAISTYMAIEHNMKILIISTTDRDETLQNCFFARQNAKTPTTGLFAPKESKSAIQNGMSGLVRMARSNKVTPDMVRNYTKVVFKDTLELLYDVAETTEENMSKYYPDIIASANQYYDLVFVDLDTNIDYEIQRTIMQASNLIIASISQRLSSIDRFIEEKKSDELLASKKTMPLIGRYDRFSKYTTKNITRYMGGRGQVIAVPYNTLLYDASEEAGLPDYFLNFVKNPNLDREDRNYLFFQEIKRAVESIQYRLQELQARF